MACIVEGCQKAIFSKGKSLCGMHYYRLLRNGDVHRLVIQERKQNWHERFWSKVNKSDKCWEWQSAIDVDGYGIFQMSYPGRKTRKAHRVAYELVKGPIEEGMTLDHLCYNTKCVNPEHLEPCSVSENAIRAARRRKIAVEFWVKETGND